MGKWILGGKVEKMDYGWKSGILAKNWKTGILSRKLEKRDFEWKIGKKKDFEWIMIFYEIFHLDISDELNFLGKFSGHPPEV